MTNKKSPWHLINAKDFLSVLCRQEAQYPIACNALHNWSGQDVERLPQRIPSKRVITAFTGMPFTRRESPCRFPLHPPQNATSFTMPSSTFSSMLLLHVPSVLYVYVIILRLLPVSCWYKPSVHRQTLPDVPPSCRWFRVVRELHLSGRSGYR